MMDPQLKKLSDAIRNVPDFPKKGIIFKDITTLLKDAELLKVTANILTEKYKNKGITKVVGIESRGFVLGSILAYNLGAGFVLLRKPGSCPQIPTRLVTTWSMEATALKYIKMP